MSPLLLTGENVKIDLMPRLTLPVSILLVFFFVVLLGQSYLRVKERIQRLELLRGEVWTLQGRKKELEEELAYRQSPTYIEKEAREQLGYAKRGEVIVVLPDFGKEEKGNVVATSSNEKTDLIDREAPIWKRWGCLWFPSSWTCP